MKHPELAFLNRELDVLHVMEVILKAETDLVQFLIYFRHCLFERRQVLIVLVLGCLVQRIRRADARYDVLSLGIDQPFSVEFILACRRVAGKSYAGG